MSLLVQRIHMSNYLSRNLFLKTGSTNGFTLAMQISNQPSSIINTDQPRRTILYSSDGYNCFILHSKRLDWQIYQIVNLATQFNSISFYFVSGDTLQGF